MHDCRSKVEIGTYYNVWAVVCVTQSHLITVNNHHICMFF